MWRIRYNDLSTLESPNPDHSRHLGSGCDLRIDRWSYRSAMAPHSELADLSRNSPCRRAARNRRRLARGKAFAPWSRIRRRAAVVGGLGAFFGWHRLIDVLIATLLINAVLATVLILRRKRLVRTLKNIGRLFAAFFRLHAPGGDLTIDSPEAATVPFGVAAAIAVVVYVIWTNAHGWRTF